MDGGSLWTGHVRAKVEVRAQDKSIDRVENKSGILCVLKGWQGGGLAYVWTKTLVRSNGTNAEGRLLTKLKGKKHFAKTRQ